MTAPKTLEALAAEMLAWADNEDHGEDVCTQLVHWSEQLRACLAARPASDLEQRMRDRAEHGDGERIADSDRELLLEAADALARQSRGLSGECPTCGTVSGRLARIVELERDKATLAEQGAVHARRVWELERELALSREAIKLARNTERKRAEAAESLLRRIIKYATEDRAATPGVTRLARVLEEAKQALAAPAQTSERCGKCAALGAIGPCDACYAAPAQPCPVASANTLGQYRCTRAAGHSGPCAAEEVEHDAG